MHGLIERPHRKLAGTAIHGYSSPGLDVRFQMACDMRRVFCIEPAIGKREQRLVIRPAGSGIPAHLRDLLAAQRSVSS